MQSIILDTFLKTPLTKLTRVPIIVVYEHPKDFPDKYVARLWGLKKPTKYVIVKEAKPQRFQQV